MNASSLSENVSFTSGITLGFGGVTKQLGGGGACDCGMFRFIDGGANGLSGVGGPQFEFRFWLLWSGYDG